MKILGGSIFGLWVFFVFIPHFFKRVNIIIKDKIIFNDVELTEYEGSKVIKIIKAEKYSKDLKAQTAEFEKINARLYTNSGEVTVDADHGSEQDRTSTYIIEKNVVVGKKDFSLKTKKLVYREGLKQVFAPGKVVIYQPGKVTSGDFMEYYLNNNTWKLKGNVKSIIKKGNN